MEKTYFTIQSDGIPIAGRVLAPGRGSGYPLVILCHGAPSGKPPEPGDGGYPALAERFCAEGYTVCFFNFRGAGESGGNIDFYGWGRDLEHVLDYLWTPGGFDTSRVYLVGVSAGAATSVYVAAHDERVAGVAACACPADFSFFTSRDNPRSVIDTYRDIGAIRDDDFPPSVEEWFENLVKMTPERHAGLIAPRPLLLVHGSLDETVPVSHAHRLYAAAGEPRELIVLEGAGHRLRQEERAVRAVLTWLGNHTHRPAD
ncbi:MAG: alpha/beta fold hydrolase [Dehalococcoidales bacterium]|nr:alpha/beta fold hydrolase [Dehalococcoidales bacterium]